ncbi:helix-turn-helix domain containing protein [Xanthobacter dioxanivorans]|uniref:Helix-turn-helix domain containing protein n=1 Tax=Xanthobacter dioxanivorans TaxID=2528964 RepID=A0A974PNH8_9HYPH|nr:helix-turn-helix domain containing protein [Xanthobacter dioxanivorans]
MPIALRTDFDAIAVRAAARRSKDGAQARRLLALAAIYEGASRTEAARIGGVTLQIVRDWVMKFNAAGPDGLIDRKAPGPQSLLKAAHRAALVEAIERGPIPAVHGVVRWRISTRATRRPETEVSGIAARHSRVTSSTTLRIRNRRPQASWSCTKSKDQRALALASTRIGARAPTARRRPRRLRTLRPSSR